MIFQKVLVYHLLHKIIVCRKHTIYILYTILYVYSPANLL